MTTDGADSNDQSLSPDEAFATLGNETRFGVLRALAEADGSVAFSELRDRVGMADSGQFNYHLDRLVGHFVEATDDGYRLRHAGRRVVEAVLSGAVTDRPSLSGERIDHSCEFCGTPIEVDWDGSGIGLYCPNCQGQYAPEHATGESADGDRGYLGHLPMPPAGVRDRDPAAAYRTAWTWGNLEILSLSSDICPRCAGPVTFDVNVCDDHDATDGTCDACENRHRIGLAVRCENCIFESGGAFVVRLVAHTALLSFLTDHGYNPIAPGRPQEVNVIHADYEEELLSEDPFRARFAFSDGDERLAMTVDDDLDVVETTRESV